jgi:hypothetical protein
MEREVSLPFSQDPAIRTCYEPAEASLQFQNTFFSYNLHFNIILPSTPSTPKHSLPFGVSLSLRCVTDILSKFSCSNL